MVKVRPWVPYLYCAPLVALLAFIFGYPMVKVVDFSTRLVRGSSGPFIGLDNYRNALDDPTFREPRKHSATLLLAVPVLLAISIVVVGDPVRAGAGLAGLPQRALHALHPRRADRRHRRRATCSRSTASSTTCSRKVGLDVARDRLDRQRALRAARPS